MHGIHDCGCSSESCPDRVQMELRETPDSKNGTKDEETDYQETESQKSLGIRWHRRRAHVGMYRGYRA